MAHITVSDLDPIIQYTASGGAQEIFTVPFPFFTDASLDVYLTPVGQTADDATDILTLTTHYTVVGAGNVEGATKEIDLVTPATDGDIITIRRNEPIARSADLAAQGDFSSETYNDEQDLLIMIAQQIRENIGRSIRQGVTGGSWDAESVVIENVADPVSAQDASTKAYTDAVGTAVTADAAAAAASAAAAVVSAAEADASADLAAASVSVLGTIPHTYAGTNADGSLTGGDYFDLLLDYASYTYIPAAYTFELQNLKTLASTVGIPEIGFLDPAGNVYVVGASAGQMDNFAVFKNQTTYDFATPARTVDADVNAAVTSGDAKVALPTPLTVNDSVFYKKIKVEIFQAGPEAGTANFPQSALITVWGGDIVSEDVFEQRIVVALPVVESAITENDVWGIRVFNLMPQTSGAGTGRKSYSVYTRNAAHTSL